MSAREEFKRGTIDALSKRAGFICSNPNCRKMTVASEESSNSGVVYMGRAAHICAAAAGGARYNKEMTMEERSGISNAIFLCSNCADIIDDNGGSDFSVDILNEWKANHESWIRTNLNKAPSEIESKVINSVTSYNQQGGITAHSVIINNKPKKRDVKNFSAGIIEELKKHPVATYRMHYSTTDTEASELAQQIDKILTDAKWEKINPIQKLGGPSLPAGIKIYMLNAQEPGITLNNQLWLALKKSGVEGEVLKDVDNIFKIHGWPAVDLPEGRQGIVMFIGQNPENE